MSKHAWRRPSPGRPMVFRIGLIWHRSDQPSMYDARPIGIIR